MDKKEVYNMEVLPLDPPFDARCFLNARRVEGVYLLVVYLLLVSSVDVAVAVGWAL